jgi:small subunit ribosomal protein S14
MAKKSMINRDAKRAKLSKSLRNKRAGLKALIMNKETTPEDRFAAAVKLDKLPKNSASNRIRNRCALTGRPRGYHRKFGLCRNALRELAAQGLLPGVTKSSW